MMRLLRNPYVLVLVTTLLTATITTLYNRTLESDTSKVNKSFFKILIFGLVSGFALVFIANRPEKVLNEPFYENDLNNTMNNGF